MYKDNSNEFVSQLLINWFENDKKFKVRNDYLKKTVISNQRLRDKPRELFNEILTHSHMNGENYATYDWNSTIFKLNSGCCKSKY